MEMDATNLTLYSNACRGQNGNIYLVCLWLHIVSTNIDHKFMISDHSYLPNDKDFGHIELSQKKTAHILVPEDWEEVVT